MVLNVPNSTFAKRTILKETSDLGGLPTLSDKFKNEIVKVIRKVQK